MNVPPDAVELLREMRDNQRLALQRQEEALAMQREQIALVRQQYDRAERINARAEALQDRGARVVRFIQYVLVPLLAVVIVLLLWR